MGMATGGGGGRRRPMSDINVTPLVDVMLVLLIIFMVTAPLIVQGVKVQLPQAKAQPIQDEKPKLVLSIDRDQHVFIGDTQVPMDQLEEKLATNAKVKKDHELYLHADKRLPYGVVVEVMAIARRAGVENLGMITDPLEQDRRPKRHR